MNSDIQYSSLCETDSNLYLAYLLAKITNHGVGSERSGRLDGAAKGKRCDSGYYHTQVGFDSSVRLAIAQKVASSMGKRLDTVVFADQPDSIRCSFCCNRNDSASVGRVSIGDAGDRDCHLRDCGRDAAVSANGCNPEIETRKMGEEVVQPAVEEKKRGRWYSKNKRKKEKKLSATGVNSASWRKDASEVPELYEGMDEEIRKLLEATEVTPERVSFSEMKARITLADCRAAENKLREKKALMTLNSMEDEDKCKSYERLKKQRIAQWTNEAYEKSQESFIRCQTIASEPKSSSSAYTDASSFQKEFVSVKSDELRAMMKSNSDLEFELNHALKYIERTSNGDYRIPVCAKTENMEGYFPPDYERPPENIPEILHSYAREVDIRDIDEDKQFSFRINQLERKMELNSRCGF